MATVTIAGVTPDAVLDVQTGSQTGDLGSATVVLADRASNRDFGSGDRVVIDRPGGETWRGYLTGKPVRESDGELEVEAVDSRYELKQRDLSRVFYDMDSGAAVAEAVEYEANGLGRRTVHDGSDLTGWDSDADVLDLGRLDGEQVHKRGSDVVFVGFREGASGSYSATFTGAPADVAPGAGQILRLETRLLVNDPGSQIEGEVEFHDGHGNSYVWPMEYRGRDFTTHELPAEEAEAGGELDSGPAVEYRFDMSGELSDDVAAAIDWAATYPFELKSRDTSLSTSGVETTGRSITRRVDRSALEFLQDMGTEDGFSSWVDESDVLHFEPSGGETSSLDIVRGQTAVTEADFDTDYDSVDNRVTVQGNPDKDISVTLEDSASIDFYGVAPRSEPIVDETIQSQSEAEDRGRGYLEDNAWGDTVVEFEIADSSYQRVGKGDAIYVRWPTRSLDGYFVAEEVNVDKGGVVTLSLGVRV